MDRVFVQRGQVVAETTARRTPAALPQVRCTCGQRLFDGKMEGQIKCQRCKRLMSFTCPELKRAL